MNNLQSKRAILAVAAALNSASLFSPEHLRRPETIREMLLGEMEDYFALSPAESSQFDRDSTLAYVSAEPLEDLVTTLDQMGKNPFSQVTSPCVTGEKGEAIPQWEVFVQQLTQELAEQSAS